MVIIISAHSCTGKTLMAQTLLKKYHMPYFSIDNLKMGIYRSDESCGFTPLDTTSHIGSKLWPILREMIKTSIENNQDMIIEGCYIYPEYLKDFDKSYLDQITPVFMGFSESYIKDNFENGILAYRSIVEARDYEEDRPVRDFISEHQNLKSLCKASPFKYFEIEKDYEQEMALVYDYIEKQIAQFVE